MMAAKRYYIAEHFEESFERLDNLRKSRETCDIRLLATNKEIFAHKLVLASASEYFKNAIYGLQLNNSGKNVLDLKDVQYEILCELVNFMYTGEIDIDSKNVYEIYTAADYYMINLLKDACLDFMEEILDTQNCVKIWIIANNRKHKKLLTEAKNFIFINVEIASNNKEFLSLSKKEILDFSTLWPKHVIFDSLITSVLKWAADKKNGDETVIKILKDIPHTNISKDYIENVLKKNKFIKNSNICYNWMLNICIEKSESKNKELKSKLKASEAKRKLPSFLLDQPIIFMSKIYCDENDDIPLTFHKYNRRNNKFSFYSSKNIKHYPYDVKTYKEWIYVVQSNCCDRFLYDDLNENGYESTFYRKHITNACAAILNNSMYIIGNTPTTSIVSSIDLNTQQTKDFNLLHNRLQTSVAVSDGSLYICCGNYPHIVERFDPREGLCTDFGKLLTYKIDMKCYAAVSFNQLYFFDGREYQIMDLRNNSICFKIASPGSTSFRLFGRCLFSSNRKIYTVSNSTIYEYVNATRKWQNHGRFPGLKYVDGAITYE